MRRGPKPKCRFCGKTIDDDPFVNIIRTKSGKEKKEFYCNEYEYKKSLSKIGKNQSTIDKERVYKLFAEIIGRDEIGNTVFWREKKDWNKLADDKHIADYLEENRISLSNSLSKIINVEFNRIRYLSAIIKNNIGDYLVKAKREQEPKKAVNIEFFNSTHQSKAKRRSLDELEDDI